MKITDIRFVRVTGRLDEPIGLDEGRPLMPADVDPAYAARPLQVSPNCLPDDDGVRRIRAIFLFVDTDVGVTGSSYQIDTGQVEVIRRQLAPWLVGRDPLAIEENWEFMFRLLGGRGLNAACSLDCALWDIKGRLEGAPVYQLLGGPKQSHIVPYAGMVGHPIELAAVGELARRVRDAGFVGQKWYPPYSLGHRADSLDLNLRFVRALREAVGPAHELMLDAHYGWTTDYAVAMARALEPYRLRWLEDPLMTDDFEGYRAVRAAATCPIASGDQLANRWQAAAMLAADAVDIFQPEPTLMCITEAMRVARLVADHGKQVAFHCGYFETLHVVTALTPELCPYYEYLWNWNQYGQWFYRHKCEPANGTMPLPPGPGLGVELDEDRIDQREQL